MSTLTLVAGPNGSGKSTLHCSHRIWKHNDRGGSSIKINPAVCHGKACIRGTRVLVSVILDNLAAGVPHVEIMRSHPAISGIGHPSGLAYAAELAREGTLELPPDILFEAEDR